MSLSIVIRFVAIEACPDNTIHRLLQCVLTHAIHFIPTNSSWLNAFYCLFMTFLFLLFMSTLTSRNSVMLCAQKY